MADPVKPSTQRHEDAPREVPELTTESGEWASNGVPAGGVPDKPEGLVRRIAWLKTRTRSTEAELAGAILDMSEGRGVPGRFLENAEYVAILYEMKDQMQEREAFFAIRLINDFCAETGAGEAEIARLMHSLLQGRGVLLPLTREETHKSLLLGLFILLKNAASNPARPAARVTIPTMLEAIEQGGGTTLADLIEYAVDAKPMA